MTIPEGTQLYVPIGEWREPEHGEYVCAFLGGEVWLHEKNGGTKEPPRHIMRRYVYVESLGAWRSYGCVCGKYPCCCEKKP
jgi:hypothetical protein